MSSFRTPRVAVSAVFILNGALYGMWASRVPAVKDSLSLDHAALGLALLFMAGGAICSFPIAGRFSDQFGAALISRLVAALYTVSLAAIPFASGFWSLALALFAFGAFHGAMDVTMNAWAAEVERAAGRPIMSSFHAMFSIGAGVGAASGFAAVSYGLSVAQHFAMVGTLFAIGTVFFASIRWTSTVSSSPKKSSLFAFPTGILALVGVLAACASIGEGAMADWSAIYLVDISKVSPQNAALGYTVFSIAMVTIRLLGDRLIFWLGPVNAARISGVSAALGAGLAVAWPGFIPSLIGFALLGVGYAVIVPLAFSRAANDDKVPTGRAIASVATLGYGGMLVGPVVIGFVSEALGLRTAFFLLVCLATLIIAVAHVLRKD